MAAKKRKRKIEIEPGKNIVSVGLLKAEHLSQMKKSLILSQLRRPEKEKPRKPPRKENREDTRSPVIVMKTDDIPLKIRQMSGLKRKITMIMTISMTLNQGISF